MHVGMEACRPLGTKMAHGSLPCSHVALAQVWSLAGSKCVATLRGHRGPIRRLEIVGGHLVSGERGGQAVTGWGAVE